MTALIALLGGMRATIFAGALLVVLAFSGAQTYRLSQAKLELVTQQKTAATDLATALSNARMKEQQFTVSIAEAGNLYEQGKHDANTTADSVVAALRADNLRLRSTWRCPAAAPVPGIASAARQPDGEAADRAESAGAIVRAASECDAQVTALQALVRADRGGQ